MNQAWFVVSWDIEGQEWSGPFESKAAAMEYGWNKKQESDLQFEYHGVVGPIEFELIGAEPGTMGVKDTSS